MSKCLVCGEEIVGKSSVRGLRRGATVVVLLTATEGLTFEGAEDEREFADRERTTEVTEELLMSEGWELGNIGIGCVVGE